MLFDLKGKRKRLVQVVYVGLAILFGGAWCCSVSAATSAEAWSMPSRAPAARSTGPSSDLVEQRRAPRGANPRNPAAGSPSCGPSSTSRPPPEGSDPETGQLTDRGQQAIIEVAQAWERYLRLKPEEDRSERRLSSPRSPIGALAGLRQGRARRKSFRRRRGRARTAISSWPTSPTAPGRSRR